MTTCITASDILNLVKDGLVSLAQGRDLLKLVAGATPAAASREAGGPMDIAIIGMAGRFPGADSVDAFWENLKAGRNSVREITRWNLDSFYSPDRSVTSRSYSKWAGMLDDIRGFDADFFNISPREALLMDPQQRLFLQEAWAAIENAGYAPQSWADKKCGVFVGCVSGDYLVHLRREGLPVDAYSLTGNTSSILAARLSYILNLKGPAVAVDTACSSSLASVHMACESLLSGASDMALAGGVMLFSTPELFVQASRLGMLSPDGLCKTFDDRADGIVLSESVGVVVLKRLEAAERDGDAIHAVIRASGINQDGKTPGITAPSAQAQTELLTATHARAGVDPATIGYVEAHGTGTRLGDPIELEALTEAFRKHTDKKSFCAIGSVKTNIGHAQIAAGITGLIKAVLCLRRKTFPPSLHLERPNQHFDFTDSPFYTLSALKHWEESVGLPRRACVSALGFSGTNAHVLLEEYTPKGRDDAGKPRAPVGDVAVLSALDHERLRAYAERLHEWLATAEERPTFADLVYTLQAGRDAMKARLAVVCSSLEELQAGLRRFLNGKPGGETCFVNTADLSSPAPASKRNLIPGAAETGDATSFARAWVAGAMVDWSAWYEPGTAKRTPLPGSVFANVPYWAEREPASVPPADAKNAPPVAHPILAMNLSSDERACFGHRFTGDEVYLKDHIVSGAPTLLGVSHLELAIAADRLSRRHDAEGGEISPRQARQIQNVAWLKPLIVADQAKEIRIDLTPGARGVAYRVFGLDEGERETLYSQGRISRIAVPEPPTHDLEAIKARCGRSRPAEECYRIFDRNDLVYGPGLRTLRQLHFNESESLARLSLPEALRDDLAAYVLHPSLMDGALQSLLGLLGDPPGDNRLYIPYALQEITVYAPLTSTCWAYARVAGNHAAAEFAEKRFDIDIIDERGRVLAAMKSLSYRPYSLRRKADPHFFTPTWKSVEPPAVGAQAEPSSTIVFVSNAEALVRWRSAFGRDVLWIAPQQAGGVGDPRALRIDFANVAEHGEFRRQLGRGAPRLLFLLENEPGPDLLRSIYQLLQAMNAARLERARLLFVSRAGRLDHMALAGFARVLRREQPNVACSLLLSDGIDDAEHERRIKRELDHTPPPGEVMVRYRDGRREVRQLEAWIPAEQGRRGALFRQGGTYLITGGAGALGMHVAAELRRRFAAQVVLCGRSAPKQVAQAVARLDHAGPAGRAGWVRYIQADVSRRREVERLMQTLSAQSLRLNGMLHAAGQIKDSLIARQNLTELDDVVAAKRDGALHLDALTRDEPLDLFILFASISSLAGSVGQAAYAYANDYLEHFSEWRNEQRAQGLRSGKTIAVNWPYWRDGGMRISAQSETLMRNAMGVEPLALEQGFDVLFGLSDSDPASLCVAAGDRGKIEKTLLIAKSAEHVAPSPAARRTTTAGANLAGVAGEILKRAADTISPQTPLADYGFDSITYVEFANRLNRVYDLDITPALFFEHKTLAAVSSHLEREYGLVELRPETAAATPEPAVAQSAPQEDAVVEALRSMAGAVLKRNPATFQADAELGGYGFDSITYVELANQINGAYDVDVTPALFFEHRTLAALGAYLREQHPHGIAQFAVRTLEETPVLSADAAPSSASAAPASSAAEPIAIIGMAGVLPGAPNLERFWERLSAGDDLIREVPADRWDWRALHSETDEPGKTRAKWGGFIDDVDKFDSLYFNISPHEAKLMDPAQRLILETVFSAIANAGYANAALQGSRTSVYIGVGALDYLNLLVAAGHPVSAYSSTGLSHSVLANRISYLLGLHGPSQPIDTACSSSLIALHRAVESIRHDGCDMAIAGGVNLILSPFLTLSFSDAGMLSEDGRCQTFSDRANGYVRGEGAGAVLLKPLSKAERDGDHIHAIIRATAENHGGRAASLTAPNPAAQAMLLVDAYTKADIDPSTITYIETHGTGTPLGDPIEINGLKSAFATLAERRGVALADVQCGLGSVKTNIGHLEAAAGMAGLFKVVLAMRRRTLPANLHFDKQNPYIKLDGGPFYIVDKKRPWDALVDPDGREAPRRAGVSSLSFSGANAHVVLEEYVPEASADETAGPQLVVMSARDRDRLLASAALLARHLETTPGLSLSDLAYTLQVGRDALNERLAIVAGDLEELARRLRHVLAGGGADEYVCFSGAAAAHAVDPAQWDEALAAGDLATLAKCWTNGRETSLSWAGLPRSGRPRRIPLPGYPFARIRHWALDDVPRPAPSIAPTLADVVAVSEEWRATPLPTKVAEAEPHVLLCCLSDPEEQAQFREIAARWAPSSRLVFLARRTGPLWGRAGYAVDAEDALQASNVIARIIEQQGSIHGLLYLWPLETPELARRPDLFVGLLQALCRRQTAPARILVAGLCRGGDDRSRLEAWLGLERSASQAAPGASWLTVIQDAVDDSPAGRRDRLERVVQEWSSTNSRGALYVGDERHQIVRRPATLAAAASPLPSARVRTWLITGGAGHLGLLFADYLARTHQTDVKLALTGRAALTTERAARLDALRFHGAQVRYFQADSADRRAMSAALNDARRAFGPIGGFIHAAGVEEGPALLETDLQRFRETLAPKIVGVEILDQLTAEDPLVYACYFSSTAALLGDMGAGGYSLANRYLLAHADWRNRQAAQGLRSGKTVAIAWPLWKEGGMGPVRAAADSDAARGLELYLRSTGQSLLTAEVGLPLFEAALAGDEAHVAVFHGEGKRLRRLLELTPAEDVEPQPQPQPPADDTVMNSAELAGRVRTDLKALCSELLQIPESELAGDAALNAFGFDSISLARLARRIQDLFAIRISPALFFSHPTLDKLSGHLADQHRGSLSARYQPREVSPDDSPGKLVAQDAPSSRPDGASRAVPAATRRQAPGRDATPEPIAIIGASGRFPDADSIDEMWRVLLEGRNAVSADKAPPGYQCGSLRGVDEFDPLFFGVSPRAAEEMDPRQRLLLEESWKALEHAGVGPTHLAAQRVGVFAGLEEGEYFRLGGEGGITANHSAITASHLAYFLDLDGPALAINTACSSGLVALHQACQSLRLGECDMALVTSASLMLTVDAFQRLDKAGMLSPDGRCYAFDRRANGMAPGEAVVALVVKPLSAALAAGDPVLSVIVGSQINYDGKTNGVTAPSGAAQEKLLKAAYAYCRLEPRQIEYVVTHGTGTALGDAVEVNALAQVFGKADGGPTCALTSTKTNFGHTLAASGLVSALCLTGALRHGVIPPSLHFENHNDFIDWADSALFVNEAARPWAACEQPRYGAVSAFGMSGTNAHLVMRDLSAAERRPAQRFSPAGAYLLAFSARSIASLCDRARQLLDFLSSPTAENMDLSAVSYTLLEGRHHFEYRCAMVVADKAEAAVLLERLLAEPLAAAQAHSQADDSFTSEIFLERAFLGKVSKRQTVQPAIERSVRALVEQMGDDLGRTEETTVSASQQKETLLALADLYRQGYDLPWRLRYPQEAPVRLALPTYPFEHGRYWVRPDGFRPTQSGEARLHPLLHGRVAAQDAPTYVSAFSGREFFLADHVIHGDKLLPGVAYLEMALAAALRAAPETLRANWKKAALAKVGWLAPMRWRDDESRVVETRLAPLDTPAGERGASFSFRVSSRVEDRNGSDDAAIVHSEGVATLEFDVDDAEDPDGGLLDVAALQRRWPVILEGDAVYSAFRQVGLAYGECCRVVEAIHRGPSQHLARLRLPAASETTGYILHPALFDGALQAVLGFFFDAGRGEATPPSEVPFALDRLEVFRPTCERMWALLDVSGKGPLRKVNARLYDEQGRLLIRLEGLSTRPLAATEPEQPRSEDDGREPIVLHRRWRAQPAATSAVIPRAPAGERHAVFLVADGQTPTTEVLARRLPWVQCHVLPVRASGIGPMALADDFRAAALALFRWIKARFGAKAGYEPLFVQVVVAGWRGQPIMLGLEGLLKTAQQENPRFIGQLIALDVLDEAGLNRVGEAAAEPSRASIWFDGAERRAAVWAPAEPRQGDARSPWRDEGCYLITGGAGELARFFAADIVAKTRQARIVLAGRSPLDGQRRDALRALERNGARIEHRQADVSRADEVHALLASIIDVHGPLHAVIHNAGQLADNFIINKTEAEFDRVLAPKVHGAACLDQAIGNRRLDLFMLCASASGATGNVGQADYAAANAFLDGFAHYRNSLVARGERQGHTLSVDWSLWAEGGMRPDEASKERLWTQLGVRPLRTETALAALHAYAHAGHAQLLVAEGDRKRASSLFGHDAAPPVDQPKVYAPKPAAADRLSATVAYFKRVLADVFGLPPHRIDARAPLEDYGIDSIMVVRLTAKLETIFGPLSKTLFFEHQTLEKVCRHFVEHHAEQLAQALGGASSDEAPASASAAESLRSVDASAERLAAASIRPAPAAKKTEFAIIGLSGRYPQAADLDQFWRNLETGRDSITEIPPERWDHARYFDADKQRPGATYGKWGGFIDDVDCFDTVFFNISPREAEILDPQERLFLQCAFHALEDAGYTRATLAAAARRRSVDDAVTQMLDSAPVGVFVGAMYNEYQLYGPEQTALGRPLAIPGNVSSIANRVSYFCNFHGPSLTLDTMCSSSLTAIHMACQSLLAGECVMAIAGGVNVTVHPNKYLVLGQGRFLSEDGRCRSFGEGGDGYVPGEGVGAALIRPLADALADGDRIHGVICASALNHGGKTNGYSVPNPNAQAALIRGALQRAAVEPRAISYIEAHGAGTALGDPIEITGLSKAFALDASAGAVAIGSVKSNIGHCESAAGMAGLTKILLQFRHRRLAPSLHAESLNRNIDFAASPFRVQRELANWTTPDGAPRMAAISSFGAGGSNAHLIVREPPPEAMAAETEEPWLIPLSARTSGQLRIKVEQLLEMVENGAAGALADIAYTLQVGREAMRERLAFSAASSQQLRSALETARNHWTELETRRTAADPAWRSPQGGLVLYRAKAGAHETAPPGQDDEATLAAWASGADVDWAKRLGGRKARRIGLPLYPFARERYWAPQPTPNALPAATPTPGEGALLAPSWRPAPGSTRARRGVDGVLMLLCTPATLALAQSLFSQPNGSTQKICLVHGAALEGSGLVEIDFHDPHSAKEAFAAFRRRVSGRAAGVIDLTALDPAYEASSRVELGKLALLQAFLGEFRQHAPRLLLVARRLAAWRCQSTLQGARTIGLYRALGAEYRSIASGVLDTDCDPNLPQVLAAQIEQEFAGEAAPGCVRRDSQRFMPTLSRLTPAAVDPSPYRADDVLLVTGGAGGVGAAVVEHVARAGVRAIAVVGREALPNAERWPALLADAGSAALPPSTLEKIRRLQALVDRGVRVQYEACVLDDAAAVSTMLATVRRTLGSISGVFHCAGLVSENPAFVSKELDAIAAVCAPKMSGLAALHAGLKQDAPRFFILFSSVSAAAPKLAAGLADYAMANAYMDHFAASRLAAGFRGVCSLQWPAWAEVGMAAGSDGRALEQAGLKPLPTAAGLQLLDRAVALALSPENPGTCLPCLIDPDRFDPDAFMAAPAPLSAALDLAPPAAPRADPASNSPDLLGAMEEWMRQMLISELKSSPEQVADRDTPFSDYGIESVMVLRLVDKMSRLIGAKLDPSLLLEFTTLGALCEHLAQTHADALTKHFAGVSGAPREDQARAPAPAAGAPARPEDIAIIGMAVRLPGADNVEAFWDQQVNGRSAIRVMTDGRWPGGDGAHAGWLQDIHHFDPDFFGLHASDAAVMDPQARLMMEESLKAIYDAGYEHRELAGKSVGVYIGGRLHVSVDHERLSAAAHPVLGVGQNYLANNLSRFFDVNGPSLVVDTACSSGLTAMSLAFDALRNGSIEMALAGSTSLLTTSHAHDLFQARNILSPDGVFRIFDERAAGDVLGEGVIALVCKTLRRAQADGDRICCVVKALAVNNDGRTLGPGSPSIKAQKDVMEKALRQAGKTARDIDYVEVNGGGSPVVDAVEIKALSQVYGLRDVDAGPCHLGSVKPSVGHLLLSSGLAGFVRCALSLRHRRIPPSQCAVHPFEHYDFSASRARFNPRAVAWEPGDGRRRVAAQSCFPDGGTNCHVILEEFEADTAYVQRRKPLPAPTLNRRSFAYGPQDEIRRRAAPADPDERLFGAELRPIPSNWGVIHEKSL